MNYKSMSVLSRSIQTRRAFSAHIQQGVRDGRFPSSDERGFALPPCCFNGCTRAASAVLPLLGDLVRPLCDLPTMDSTGFLSSTCFSLLTVSAGAELSLSFWSSSSDISQSSASPLPRISSSVAEFSAATASSPSEPAPSSGSLSLPSLFKVYSTRNERMHRRHGTNALYYKAFDCVQC
jgi:hypothetical protein